MLAWVTIPGRDPMALPADPGITLTAYSFARQLIGSVMTSPVSG